VTFIAEGLFVLQKCHYHLLGTTVSNFLSLNNILAGNSNDLSIVNGHIYS